VTNVLSPSVTTELHWLPARELARGLRARAFSAVEVVQAHLDQLERVNPLVNAVVTLDAERAMTAAAAADDALASGSELPPLHGLPVAVKDLEDTAGMRTTYGSPLFAEHVPSSDGVLADRLRRAGAIIVGKTNTPEFGAGSQTFNPVFGATRNPYDLSKTAGGSSGGAAAALAAGILPIADGSDLASSIRNPASFCNVVGLRPSPGRWPSQSSFDAWSPLSVLGPIARDVADVGFFLAAVAGDDERSPLALTEALSIDDAAGDLRGIRVAWSPDLGDLPVEPLVTAVLDRHQATFRELGCTVAVDAPDLAAADRGFDVLRALSFLGAHGELAAEHPDKFKETIRWNVARGVALTPQEIADAFVERTRAFHTMREFLHRYDVLALPVSQLAPFSIDVEWPREVAGVPMEHYVQWLRTCSRITMTAHPAIAVPAGFTDDGLPIGLQLVGRYRGEVDLLRIARAFEAVTGFGALRPPVAA
jgi:amidase